MEKYRPIFAENKIKDHLDKVYEACKNGYSISIPRMFEAAIHTKKYAKLLQNKFLYIAKHIDKSKFSTTISLLRYLDSEFETYNILFKFDSIEPQEEAHLCGITEMVTEGKNKTIIVFCNNAFKRNFLKADNTLFQSFYELISHELVHRGQYLLRSYKISYKIMQKILKDKSDIENNSSLSDEQKETLKTRKYLSNRYELMSYANQIVEELRFNGFDNKKIVDVCKSFELPSEYSNGASMYDDFFDKDEKKDLLILKQLFKYMYQYITGIEKHNYLFEGE